MRLIRNNREVATCHELTSGRGGETPVDHGDNGDFGILLKIITKSLIIDI